MCRNTIFRFYTAHILVLLAWLCVGAFSAAQAETSNEYLQEAQGYAKKGDVNSAIIQLKNALQKDPKNIKARYFLGLNYLRRGDGAGAEKEFDRARSLGMPLQELAIPLGRAYLMQGKAQEMLTEIKLDDAYPNDVNSGIHVLRASAYLGLGDEDKAAKAYQEALKLDPHSLDALLGQARMAVGQHQFDTAQGLTDRVLKEQPKSGEAWTVQGEIARLKGDFPSAKTSFDKAVELEPASVPALLGSASVSIALGDMAMAKNRIDTILRYLPNHPIANYLHAVVLFQEKDLDGAAEALQAVLQRAPDHIPSLQLMGSIDFAKGRLEQAVQELSRVGTAVPDNIPVAKLLAATHLKLKQPAKAVEVLENVVAKAPQDAQLLALIGTAYIQNQQTEKGTEYLERAVEAAPDAAGIRTQLALGRLASGETMEAVKDLESAVDLGQNVFQADVLLTMVHLRKREFRQALESAQDFVKKLPDNPLPYNLMGVASLGLNNPKAARENFEKALEKDPKFLPAILNVAHLDESEGNVDAARQKYLFVLKQQEGHVGALMSLAKISEQQGNEEQALKYYETAWKDNSGAVQPGLVLIDYFNRKRQPLRAISIARELKALHPENPMVLSALGTSQMAAKDFRNAVNTFTEMVKLLPQSEQAHYLLGQGNFAADDTGAARSQFKKALGIKKDFLPAQIALARLEMKSNRTNDAMQIAQTIQKQRPKEEAGYRLEGDVWMNKGDYSKAADVYRHAYERFKTSALAVANFEARKRARIAKPYLPLEDWLKDHPDDASVHFILGGAYQEEQKLAAAVKQYELVVKNMPNNVAALNNLAWASHELKQPGAVGYAERAYALASDAPAVIDTLGWLLVETGNSGRGLTLLQEAVAKAPHIAEIRYHLAVGLHKAGRNAEAKAELEKVLEMEQDSAAANNAQALLTELSKI